MIIPLVIDNATRSKINKLRKHASENVTPLHVMEALLGKPAPGGLNDEFTITIPTMFTATYTEEMQPGNIQCKHLSVSVDIPDLIPNPAVVKLLMYEFGFVNIEMAVTWPEKFGNNTQVAINIVEPVSGDMSELLKK
jgi:hypothetical protein